MVFDYLERWRRVDGRDFTSGEPCPADPACVFETLYLGNDLFRARWFN